MKVIMAFYLSIMIDCSKPRMDYQTFFEQSTGIKYPGQRGEDWNMIQIRALNVLADYSNYVVNYRDGCKLKGSVK